MKLFAVLLVFPVLNLVSAEVRFERVPESGIQPQVIVEGQKQHLLFFKGDAMGGDVFYAAREAAEKKFSPAVKINKEPNSVIVAGTMRGPQMAIGSGGRAHVVWMGGKGATKVKVGDENVTPLLYARMNVKLGRFEPEQNILTIAAGLDGGQTVAADQQGNVYVIWHGAPPGVEGEENRALYVARSSDEGLTFRPEAKAQLGGEIGSCACCGVRAEMDENGLLHVLFRGMEKGTNRNELWLTSKDHGKTFSRIYESVWNIATCPASSASFAEGKAAMIGAWEFEHGVMASIWKGRTVPQVNLRPDSLGKAKHPRVATNARGEVLVTWVENAGWGEKGTLACQVFDANGKVMGPPVRKTELPAWSFGAPYATAEGDFVVLY